MVQPSLGSISASKENHARKLPSEISLRLIGKDWVTHPPQRPITVKGTAWTYGSNSVMVQPIFGHVAGHPNKIRIRGEPG